MPVLPLVPIALALSALAAHFYRAGATLPLVATLALVALLPLRQRWVARLLQTGLLLGTLEWLRTLAALIEIRQATGQPFGRLATILGSVAVATLLCTALFRLRALHVHYRLPPQDGPMVIAAGAPKLRAPR